MVELWINQVCEASNMTQVEQMAGFVAGAAFDKLSRLARQQLKMRVLDALGCAVGALGSPPLRMLKAQIDDFGGHATRNMPSRRPGASSMRAPT